MMQHMLSLKTNPYDPFDEWLLWWNYDRAQGFDTAGLMARVLSNSDAMSQADQDQADSDAVDSIVNNEAFGDLYVKISRDR